MTSRLALHTKIGRQRLLQPVAMTRTGPVPQPPPPQVLGKDYFRAVPREEDQRPYYGRSVDLNRIQSAIRAANHGFMRQITDLSLESISVDGHCSAVLNKRINRLAALPWEVEAADVAGSQRQRAEEYAAIVREQLQMIPAFRQRLMDIAWAVFHGRAALELQWAFRGGMWAVIDLHWIHPRRLSYGPDRDVRVIDLRSERGNFQDVGFPLDAVPYKFCTYTPRIFGDYAEREGLAPRTLYWSFFQRFGVRDRMELMEIFGKPWRIVMPKSDPNLPEPSKDDLAAAFRAINGLGASSTARLPKAMEVMIAQPVQGAGQVHADSIEHAQQIISKLVLGQTGTTDAVSTGLGSSIGNAMLSEEDLIVAVDAWRASEVLEDQITDAIIAVNFGPAAVPLAPHFKLRTDPPMNRAEEADLITKAQATGLKVAEDDARGRLGFRELRDGDSVLTPPPPAQPGGFGALGGPPAPPAAPSAPPRVSPDEPVELDDDEPGSSPLAAPPPESPLDEAVEHLAERMTELGIDRCEHGRPNRCPICGVERVRHVERGADGEPVWSGGWRPIGSTGRPGASPPAILPIAATARPADAPGEPDRTIALAAPERTAATLYGSPDDLVARGVLAVAKLTGELATALAEAVGGKGTIREALASARARSRRFGRAKLQDAIENEILRAAMLGALDAQWEGDEDRPVEVESFRDLWPDAILLKEGDEEPFARRPREPALNAFLERAPVTRDVFDDMTRAARSRAFTVAGELVDGALERVQAALSAQIGEGAALRDFQKAVTERLETAGWTPLNPSHIETVFRTNVQTAYNDGRFAQVTDPDVMAARPYTQILGVRDSRTRGAPGSKLPPGAGNHWAAQQLIFRTEDLSRLDLPPWGYNCRCRFRSLSQRQVGDRRIAEVSELRGLGLPDRGFN